MYLLPITKAQKMAIRLIFNLKNREHTSIFFKELRILKFPDLVEYKINVLMYKALFTNLPENLQCVFKSNSENKHCTRQLCNFKVKFSKSKIKSNCLSINGVKLWNKLGDNMKTCGSLLSLKKI